MTTAQIAGLLASTILPLLVGYVTKASTNPTLKALLLLLLTAGVTAATSVASGANVKSSITTGLLAYATAVASHFGFLKPSGAADAALNSGNKDPVDEPEEVDLEEDDDVDWDDEEFDPGFPEELLDVAAPELEETDVEPTEAEATGEDDATPES